MQGAQEVSVSFTSGQLDDVLKSLTVLDLNGGRVTGIGYDSAAPVAKQLEELRLKVGDRGSLTDFLAGLRGARVEIRSGAAIMTGRLLSVERKTRMGGGTTLEVDYVSLVSDAGEVRTVELTSGFAVRLLEKELAGKVGHYLDLLGQSRQSDARKLTIATAGTGERSLFVSYISEVPIWKTTYRIVLSNKSQPLLQGWAIVDNTIGQDWNKVELSLVAGAPQSFVQNISQPHYARRPVIAMRDMGSIVPQTHESTLTVGGGRIAGRITDATGAGIPGATVRVLNSNGAQLADTYVKPDGSYEIGGLPEGEVQLQVTSPGFQTATVRGVQVSAARAAWQQVRLNIGGLAETVEIRASPPPLQTSTSMASVARRKAAPAEPAPPMSVDDARAQVQAAAQGQEVGDLYEYKLKEPVTIARTRSALVPILQSSIAAEKVSIWNDSLGGTRPRRALWLTNSTGSTLDSGAFSISEENTFAGEGLLDSIKAGEKRLISYALDTAVTATTRESNSPQRVTRVRIAKGVLTQESEVRESRTYTFRNEDAGPRTIVVEHRARPGYEIRGEVKPVETSAGLLRFRVAVPPKETATLDVPESRPIQASWTISDLNTANITAFVSQGSIDRTIEEALRRVIAQKEILGDIRHRIEQRRAEEERIGRDQTRLRENMKALKGTPEEKALLQRYTMQLNEQENRLDALRKEVESLEAEEQKADDALDRLIETLSFDIKL